MADRWFRIPETGTGTTTDPYRPDYVDTLGLDWSGNEAHPEGAPVWVARVYGTASELDTLAGKQGVTEYSNVPKTALDQMFGQDRSKSEWGEAFSVG